MHAGDKPLSGQRIVRGGAVQNNREEPRDREPEGCHAPTPSLPQAPAHYELAMYTCPGRIARIQEAGSGRGSIRMMLLEHFLSALFDLIG